MIIRDKTDPYFGRDLDAMSAAKGYHRSILQTFRPYIGKRVLEVGAGIGNLSELILECSIDRLYALEPSENMYALLEKNFIGRDQVTPMHGFLGSVLSRIDTPFDTAIYVNVMEHVEEDETELQLLKGVLHPGGHLCIYVPAINALYSKFDESLGHFRRYAMSDLRGKLENAGYEILALRYSDLPGFFAWWLFCKVFQRELSHGSVGIYDRVVVPVNTLLERLIPLPFGKNLFAIARVR